MKPCMLNSDPGISTTLGLLHHGSPQTTETLSFFPKSLQMACTYWHQPHKAAVKASGSTESTMQVSQEKAGTQRGQKHLKMS